MNTFRKTNLLASASFALLLVGCGASAPPKELVDARSAYQTASRGPASEYSSPDLNAAKLALDDAEKSYADDGDSDQTRDRAKVALAKAQAADAAGVAAKSQRDKAESERKAASDKAQADQQAQVDAAKKNLVAAREKTEAEKAQDLAAKKGYQALVDLQKVAETKPIDGRGIVITLPGAALFSGGDTSTTITPAAKVKLDAIAEAIKLNPDAKVSIEGYTDSQGDANNNKAISLRRADAVRDYFATKTLKKDRFKTEGFGPEKPVDHNSSAEGRAANRRVEIAVDVKEPK